MQQNSDRKDRLTVGMRNWNEGYERERDDGLRHGDYDHDGKLLSVSFDYKPSHK
jgi:hypothetical protein